MSAVHELAANAVRHGAGSGRLVMLATAGALRCLVSDAGPEAGPWPVRQGHGLWIARAVADQLAVSSGLRGSRGPGSETAAPGRPRAGTLPGPPRKCPASRKGDIICVVTELSVSVRAEGEGGSRTVVRLVGEADVTTRALGDVLGAEAAKKPRLLLVDVSGLAFIDSAALHEIVRAYRKLLAHGCRLALVGPNLRVARVLQLSGLDEVIPVHASAEEAAAQ